ncbi:hypothetical protein DFQ26_002146 [Actinomortierella ambigua]|nr:hypothetical protein DFQ26_002146 [Actinomortierella ambigua]
MSSDLHASSDSLTHPSMPSERQQQPQSKQNTQRVTSAKMDEAKVAGMEETLLLAQESNGTDPSEGRKAIRDGTTNKSILDEEEEEEDDDDDDEQQQHDVDHELLRHASNPLLRLESQVGLPQVAGAAPTLPAPIGPDGQAMDRKQLQQEYLSRLELDRTNLAGSLYFELDPKDLPQISSPQQELQPFSLPHLSKEIFPWDVWGLEDNDDDEEEGLDEALVDEELDADDANAADVNSVKSQEYKLHRSLTRVDLVGLKTDTKPDRDPELDSMEDAHAPVDDVSIGDTQLRGSQDDHLPACSCSSSTSKSSSHSMEPKAKEVISEIATSVKDSDDGSTTVDAEQDYVSLEDPHKDECTCGKKQQDGLEGNAKTPPLSEQPCCKHCQMVSASNSSISSAGNDTTKLDEEHDAPVAAPDDPNVTGSAGEIVQDPADPPSTPHHPRYEHRRTKSRAFRRGLQRQDEIDTRPRGHGKAEFDENEIQDQQIVEMHEVDNAMDQESETSIEGINQDIDEDGTMTPDAASRGPYSKLVHPFLQGDPTSALAYEAYNHHGDRIMDFSMVGWNEGNSPLPDARKIPVLEQLFPRAGAESDRDQGDDSVRIQEALDRALKHVAGAVTSETMEPLGAVVLERGVYRLSHPLTIKGSGILFRGDPEGGTRIVCQWPSSGYRYAIEINSFVRDEILKASRVPVVAQYTPVGSFSLSLDPEYLASAGYNVGDSVVVTRVGNKQWVHDVHMDYFPNEGKKGRKPWTHMNILMYRTIRSLDVLTGIVQLDAPLPVAISREYGGGWMTKIGADRKIRAIGIQYLDMVFSSNIGRHTPDEMREKKGRGAVDYRFSSELLFNYALRLNNVQHSYVTHITSAYFHNVLSTGSSSHHLTMDSIVHSYPEEMFSGQAAFMLSCQLSLVRNCLSQGSLHFFVEISRVPGPNVIHRVQAINAGRPDQPMLADFEPGTIGPHEKFCTGILMDQVVTDGAIKIENRGGKGTGQGFTGANSVIWNSRARQGIITHRAKGFQNFVIGSEEFEALTDHPQESQGWKEHLGAEVLPGSLYLRQLADRQERLKRGWVA